MNMGGLATLARYRPANLTHIIFDNGSLLSTGGFATHTTNGITDLAAVAKGAGCPSVFPANNLYQFMEAAAEAFENEQMTTIVAKVEAVGPDHYGMDFKLPENAFRFERFVREKQSSL
jgi:sulfopyruvate decarboxylase subunit beta